MKCIIFYLKKLLEYYIFNKVGVFFHVISQKSVIFSGGNYIPLTILLKLLNGF